MRWIFGLIGALLGGSWGEEEGALFGFACGVLFGLALEREKRRKVYLAQRAGGASSGDRPEQSSDARLAELTERVAELERRVAALQAQASAEAFPTSAPGHATVRVPPAGSEAERATVAEPAAGSVTGAEPAPVAESATVAEAMAETLSATAPEPVTTVAEPVTGARSATAAESATSAERVTGFAHAPAIGPAAARPPSAPPPAVGTAPTPASSDGAGATRSAAPTANAPRLASPAPGRVVDALRAFAFGGNTVVRAGVLVLTVGVGLLVKYAAEQAYFPLEARLAFAAALGLALIVVGYKLRRARPGFATALQGGGVAATYLVTFFAYYAYELLPAALTALLLIALAVLSSLLAVVQNAVQLAVFGAIGGFLSPLLASSGQGSHIALFSYYALLNAAIAGIALFRSWRILNWVGFAFTFGIASTWGVLRYEPEHMASAGFFLGLFFLFYVLNGTLFALKQPAEEQHSAGAPEGALRHRSARAPEGALRRGTVDTTLTFGTPLATLALAGGLFRTTHLHLALACLAIASVYLACARFLLARQEPALRPLARAYVAIGIGVLTLAIPFALESALATALAWAAEASGLVWVGLEQRRLRTRVGGYLLYFASLCALLAQREAASASGRALFLALMAAGFAFAAVQLERGRATLAAHEPYVGHALFVIALALWGGAWHALIELAPAPLVAACWLAAAALSALLFDVGGERARFDSARKVARWTFPALLAGALIRLANATHPCADFAWIGFAAAIAAGYAVLWRQSGLLDAQPLLRDALHASAVYLLAVLSFAEARYFAGDALALAAGWVDASCLLSPLVPAVFALAHWPRWPLAALPRAYVAWSTWPLAWMMCLAALACQAASTGDPAPLPYLPLLNPLDLAQALVLSTLVLLARTITGSEARRGDAPAHSGAADTARSPAPAPASTSSRSRASTSFRSLGPARTSTLVPALAIASFVALNGTVVRTAHHWADVPFTPWQIPSAPVVQASFSILWTTLALIAMIAAHRRRLRSAWIAGAALLGTVVIKLFLLDLARLSSVTKIITFLAVGMLLLLIGYLAPVPPAEGAREERT